MSLTQYMVLSYILFWAIRIRGCVRRWRQPLVRGPGWFFNVQVRPDFYTGSGKKLLHHYWMRMFIPFAVDIPVATAIFLSGRFLYINWLILGLSALIHINHLLSVGLAQRQAQPFAVVEDGQPAPALVFSVKTRRMGHSETVMWPVCYQPSAPMSMLKGARGYSLNLANTLTQLGAAYLAGMAVLLGLLVMKR